MDFENLCELPEAIIQQVEAIMEENIGDKIDELIDIDIKFICFSLNFFLRFFSFLVYRTRSISSRGHYLPFPKLT